MSPIAFHSAAADAFNAKAISVAARVVRENPQPQVRPGFVPDVPVVYRFTDADLAGPIQATTVDIDGRTCSRSFFKDNHKYTLEGEALVTCLQLVDSVYRHSHVQTVLSKRYIEALVFEWIEEAHGATTTPRPLTELLSARAATDVAAQVVWHPIYALHVERPFALARSEVRPISGEQIETWVDDACRAMPDQTAEVRDALRAKFRPFQGLAAVVTKVTAEPTRATEIAREQADLLCAVLALVSPALVRLNIASPTRPFGAQYIPTTASLIETGGSLHSFSLGVRSPWGMEPLTLTAQAVESLSREVFAWIAPLLIPSPTRFCAGVLDALLIYTRAAFTADPVEKLLYVLAALEGLLLKSDTEPIQQNVGERLAFYLADSKDERKRIPKLVRSTYSIRSAFLHHGRPFSEQDTLRNFLSLAHSFWTKLLLQLDQHESKAAFVEHIDDIKFS